MNKQKLSVHSIHTGMYHWKMLFYCVSVEDMPCIKIIKTVNKNISITHKFCNCGIGYSFSKRHNRDVRVKPA